MPLNPFAKAKYTMMRLMARLMPSCKEVSALVSQGLDERLPLIKRLSIRLHVSLCSLCRRYEKQLYLLREGARHYANPDENEIEESLSAEAKHRLKAMLESEEK